MSEVSGLTGLIFHSVLCLRTAFSSSLFPSLLPLDDPLRRMTVGAVEKSRQRRSRPFPMLTYWKYALRAKKWLRPCWTNFF